MHMCRITCKNAKYIHVYIYIHICTQILQLSIILLLSFIASSCLVCLVVCWAHIQLLRTGNFAQIHSENWISAYKPLFELLVDFSSHLFCKHNTELIEACVVFILVIIQLNQLIPAFQLPMDLDKIHWYRMLKPSVNFMLMTHDRENLQFVSHLYVTFTLDSMSRWSPNVRCIGHLHLPVLGVSQPCSKCMRQWHARSGFQSHKWHKCHKCHKWCLWELDLHHILSQCQQHKRCLGVFRFLVQKVDPEVFGGKIWTKNGSVKDSGSTLAESCLRLLVQSCHNGHLLQCAWHLLS